MAVPTTTFSVYKSSFPLPLHSSINQASDLTTLHKRARKPYPCAIALLILFPDFDHPLALSYLGIPDQSSHKSHSSPRQSPRCLRTNTHLALPTAQTPLTLILPVPSLHQKVIHPPYLPTSSVRTPLRSRATNYTDSQLIVYHITGEAYKPSGSTTISSSHRTPAGPKLEIHYHSTNKDADHRSKFYDSGYYL